MDKLLLAKWRGAVAYEKFKVPMNILWMGMFDLRGGC